MKRHYDTPPQRKTAQFGPGLHVGENPTGRPRSRFPHYGPQIRSFEQETTRRKKSGDWLAVDAVPRELFSAQIPCYQGKIQGILRFPSHICGDKYLQESTLAGRTAFQRRIGTGIEQGRSREYNSLLRDGLPLKSRFRTGS